MQRLMRNVKSKRFLVLDKTILIIMGISIPVVMAVVIFGVMSSVQRTNEFSDAMNADKLLQDLKIWQDYNITIL